MEVKRREMCHTGEPLELEWLIEMLVDVFHDPVHPSRVFRAAIYVETSNFSGFHSMPSAVGPAM